MKRKDVRILMFYNCEDEATFIDNALKKAGYEDVVVTDNVPSGLAYFSYSKVDVIVSCCTFYNKDFTLRLFNKKALSGIPLIFYTNDYTEYLEYIKSDIFSVKNNCYLIFKPETNVLLSAMLLKLAKSKIKGDTLNYVCLKNKHSELKRVYFNDILYIESDVTFCSIHTKWESFTSGMTMACFNKMIKGNFIKVHYKYTVNVDHISRVLEKEVLVENFLLPLFSTKLNETKKNISTLKKRRNTIKSEFSDIKVYAA